LTGTALHDALQPDLGPSIHAHRHRSHSNFTTCLSYDRNKLQCSNGLPFEIRNQVLEDICWGLQTGPLVQANCGEVHVHPGIGVVITDPNAGRRVPSLTPGVESPALPVLDRICRSDEAVAVPPPLVGTAKLRLHSEVVPGAGRAPVGRLVVHHDGVGPAAVFIAKIPCPPDDVAGPAIVSPLSSGIPHAHVMRSIIIFPDLRVALHGLCAARGPVGGVRPVEAGSPVGERRCGRGKRVGGSRSLWDSGDGWGVHRGRVGARVERHAGAVPRGALRRAVGA
jgi:hypothetical protein